jgi:hypothetical protein
MGLHGAPCEPTNHRPSQLLGALRHNLFGSCGGLVCRVGIGRLSRLRCLHSKIPSGHELCIHCESGIVPVKVPVLECLLEISGFAITHIPLRDRAMLARE